MQASRLPSLPGTAPAGSWRITTADLDDGDGRLAIFAIAVRDTPKSLRLLGTGFYIVTNGGFATAKHVALEAQQHLLHTPDSVGLLHTISDGITIFRPIWQFFIHPTADIAFGLPHYDLIDNQTGKADRSKVLSLDVGCPEVGSTISTWSYPLHSVIGDDESGRFLQLQPDFYNGTLQEIFMTAGPSAKLLPPYYQTNIHLHGGSSGGPVFNAAGYVFGIASCSYDGAEDIAFVTPVSPILEIELQMTTYRSDDGSTWPINTVRELGTMGVIRLRSPL
jgi:hypothetical protein